MQCTLDKGSEEYEVYMKRAMRLASAVYPNAANDSELARSKNRKMQDAFGGVLAEQGWLKFINQTYGLIASETQFETANGQIDIVLKNGERIEVRSSFPRNGVKFAICNERFNFKVIGAYSNLYKPGEVRKDFFALVLFETKKDDILTTDKVIFSLIGGATEEMMKKLGFTTDLVADGDLTETTTRYQVVYVKDAWDINQFETWMKSYGY